MSKQKMAVDYTNFTVADWAEEVADKQFKDPETLEKFDDDWKRIWKKVGAMLKALVILNDEKRENKNAEIMAPENERRRIVEFIKMLFDKASNVSGETRGKVLKMIPLDKGIKNLLLSSYAKSPADTLSVAGELDEVMEKAA